MNLEDEFGDFIKKASFGLKISKEELTSRTNIPLERLQEFLNYKSNPSEEELIKISQELKLDEEKTKNIVLNNWHPSKKVHEDVILISQDYGESIVNSYIIKNGNEAIIIDTGLRAKELIRELEKKELVPIAILITHNHPDHISGIEELKKRFVCEVYKNLKEKDLEFDNFKIRSLKTPGHTTNHNCLLYKNYCFVGDLLFAGSIGNSNEVPYEVHLKSIKEKILSLPDETLLFPGHGPVTSVKEEKQNNPFL